MENINDFNVCYWCMNKLENGKDVCSHCGKSVSDIVSNSRGLNVGTILNNKYLIGNVIGEGGFGITYIAYDTMIDTRIAIKEYFPSDFATRDTTVRDNKDIVALTGECGEKFKKGMEKFVNEAKRLAKFNQEDGIVSVKDFFYENDTAYMVMEYIEGSSLKNILNNSSDGVIPWEQTVNMMIPVIDSLSKVHKQGIIHRDISPDNILVTPDGKVKLIDFGAARYVDQDNNKSLTVMLKHGYAPEEQYETNSEQGSWTDVYSICATMYRMITGQVPTESVERVLESDKLEHISKKEKNMPYNIASAIMKGLSIKAKDRQQSMEELKESLQKPQSKLKEIVVKHWKKVGLVALLASLCFCAYNLGNIFSKDEIVVDNSKKDKDYEQSNTTDETTEENTTEEKIKKVELPKEKLIKMIEEKSDFHVICCESDGINGEFIQNKKMSTYCDYDGDGVKELFAITGDTKGHNGYGNLELWYADCDGIKKIDEHLNDYVHDMTFQCDIARVGKNQHFVFLLVPRVWDGLVPKEFFTVYSVENGEVVKGDIGVDPHLDKDGYLCTMDYGYLRSDHEDESGLASGPGIERRIFYKDGQYFRCEGRKITYEQLCMFSNGEEIYKKAMDILNKEEYLGDTKEEKDGNYELKKGNIYYSSDGKVYMNFTRTTNRQKEYITNDGITNEDVCYYYYASAERQGDKLVNLDVPKSELQHKYDSVCNVLYEDFKDPRKN